ncbi:prephenate dehydratase domain-containing protein, partial [Mesoflavibacter profundi]
MTKTIAIQGIQGSFHHIVSLDYYDNTHKVKECLTFDETVASLFNNTAETAIMALENSIAGSILPNYALIDNNDLHIVGEH